MSKDELLKYLIAEIDLIMHDKDYRFENDNGTWYSRESCRDLTNEEVFEELKGELKQLSDLQSQLAERDEEIKRLKNRPLSILAPTRQNGKAKLIEIKLSELQNQKAIAELEKVKNFVDGRTYLAHYIDQQIELLKGKQK